MPVGMGYGGADAVPKLEPKGGSGDPAGHADRGPDKPTGVVPPMVIAAL